MAVAIVLFLATAVLAVGLVGSSVEADQRSQAANAAACEAIRQTARAQASVAGLENERGRPYETAIGVRDVLTTRSPVGSNAAAETLPACLWHLVDAHNVVGVKIGLLDRAAASLSAVAKKQAPV